MNRQRQAVECKICPGVVHSYPPKPITRSVEPKTVSLMRRKSAFQVACHAHRRSPHIRSIANLLIYLPFIRAARFFQKKLRRSWLRDTQRTCSDACSNNAVPKLTDIELCNDLLQYSGVQQNAELAIERQRTARTPLPGSLDRSGTHRDAVDRHPLPNNDEAKQRGDSIETKTGQWTSTDASVSLDGCDTDVMTTSNGRPRVLDAAINRTFTQVE